MQRKTGAALVIGCLGFASVGFATTEIACEDPASHRRLEVKEGATGVEVTLKRYGYVARELGVVADSDAAAATTFTLPAGVCRFSQGTLPVVYCLRSFTGTEATVQARGPDGVPVGERPLRFFSLKLQSVRYTYVGAPGLDRDAVNTTVDGYFQISSDVSTRDANETLLWRSDFCTSR